MGDTAQPIVGTQIFLYNFLQLYLNLQLFQNKKALKSEKREERGKRWKELKSYETFTEHNEIRLEISIRRYFEIL